MGLFTRQPKRSVPEPVKPPKHSTQPVKESDGALLTSFRQRVLGMTTMIVAVGVAAIAVYGPWFEVRSVTVTGTREIVPSSVKAVADEYLATWRFGVIPNKNLWLLSRRDFAAALEKKIRERVSIEEVRIVKNNRHDLTIAITERLPVAVWRSGNAEAIIDATGTIISATAAQELPRIVDLGEHEFTVGEQILTEPAMRGWQTLNDAFLASSLQVEEYRIPLPTCPTKIIEPEVDANLNTNSGNAPIANLNGNVNAEPPPDEALPTSNENTNTGPKVVVTECDVAALAKSSQEIHAQLVDGPVVLFDRHQNLPLAVQTVQRLLGNAENSVATYIDIRFQERVYVK